MYPNDEFVRRTANFRDELEAFMKTADDEGNPNPDYTFEDQNKLYETMMNKAYDLALFIETQEADGYRLVKAEADPVEATTPDLSPAPMDDDEWLQDVLSDEGVQTRIPSVKDLAEMFDLEYDEEDEEIPAWLIDEDEDGIELSHYIIEDDPDERAFTLTDQARAMLATLHEPVTITDYPVAFEPVEIISMGDNEDD